MTVRKWLEETRPRLIIPDLLKLLDEYAEEKCSVLAGKIRAQTVPPAPTVYCPKDTKEVPCWYCLGSVTQGREVCPYLVIAEIHGAESAKVECKWKPE